MQKVPIAIVAALDDEIRLMKSRIDVDSRVHIRPALFIMGKLDGRQILLGRSGVGFGRMQRAARYLAENYRPQLCLHVGYCGGCDPRYAPGDLIIASSVLNERDGRIADASDALVKQAEDICRRRELRFGTGRIVTVEKAARTPHEKAFIGTHHGAAAIDMESFAFMEMMSQVHLPHLVVRAVVDSLDVSLPVFGAAMASDGSISSVGLAENMIMHPKNILDIPKIACCANQARQAISTFVESWQEVA